MALGKCKHGTKYKGKWYNAVIVFVLQQTRNILGSGPELLRCVFEMGKLLLWFTEGDLSKEHVCIAFTKPAGLALKALKSLFTVEQSEILVALKSATPWRQTLKCTVQVDGLLRWNDINLCHDSRIRHFTNVKWNKTTRGGRKPDWLQSE